ncbi:response regulator transcription factor [Sphingomonas sp. ID0503]|uniref:response regulator transcription factor n=1 Tax=Sphingomonas sp. ID0503 TaxID=3399691 RepID=UPI003AFA89AE
MRIAILEDEPPLAAQMSQLLTGAGHNCHVFPTTRAFQTWLQRETFDLLVMDWMLPDGTGLEALKKARANLEAVPPTIFVTSRSEEGDIVAALEAGADDYVVKPIRPQEMLARVGALLRRNYPAATGAVETFDDYVFDPAGDMLTIAGERVVLTAKEFALSLLLFQNMHRPLSRAYLLEKVWGRNPDLPTRTLDAHISRVRTKLGLRPDQGFRLSPVYSFGYRLERIEPAAGAQPE